MSGCRTVGNWYLIGEHNWELTHQCNWFRRNFDPPLRIDLSSSKLRSFPGGPAGLVFTQGWDLPRGTYLSTIKDAIKIGQLGPFRGNLQPQSDFWQICCFSPWPMDMCPIVDTSWAQWWTQGGLLPGTNGWRSHWTQTGGHWTGWVTLAGWTGLLLLHQSRIRHGQLHCTLHYILNNAHWKLHIA